MKLYDTPNKTFNSTNFHNTIYCPASLLSSKKKPSYNNNSHQVLACIISRPIHIEAKPIKIAGLAVGRIILKSVSKPLKPKLLPTSNKFLDWFKNDNKYD